MHDDEREIADLIHERLHAIDAKDARRAVATLSPKVVVYEMVPPLRLDAGAATDVDATAAWLAAWRSVHIEVRDLVIHAAQDVAFAHALHRLSGTTIDGRHVRIWLRSTLGFRKEHGKWTIIHAHSSVPFRPDGKAALDLEPSESGMSQTR